MGQRKPCDYFESLGVKNYPEYRKKYNIPTNAQTYEYFIDNSQKLTRSDLGKSGIYFHGEEEEIAKGDFDKFISEERFYPDFYASEISDLPQFLSMLNNDLDAKIPVGVHEGALVPSKIKNILHRKVTTTALFAAPSVTLKDNVTTVLDGYTYNSYKNGYIQKTEPDGSVSYYCAKRKLALCYQPEVYMEENEDVVESVHELVYPVEFNVTEAKAYLFDLDHDRFLDRENGETEESFFTECLAELSIDSFHLIHAGRTYYIIIPIKKLYFNTKERRALYNDTYEKLRVCLEKLLSRKLFHIPGTPYLPCFQRVCLTGEIYTEKQLSRFYLSDLLKTANDFLKENDCCVRTGEVIRKNFLSREKRVENTFFLAVKYGKINYTRTGIASAIGVLASFYAYHYKSKQKVLPLVVKLAEELNYADCFSGDSRERMMAKLNFIVDFSFSHVNETLNESGLVPHFNPYRNETVLLRFGFGDYQELIDICEKEGINPRETILNHYYYQLRKEASKSKKSEMFARLQQLAKDFACRNQLGQKRALKKHEKASFNQMFQELAGVFEYSVNTLKKYFRLALYLLEIKLLTHPEFLRGGFPFALATDASPAVYRPLFDPPNSDSDERREQIEVLSPPFQFS